jgi:hypothetical protein
MRLCWPMCTNALISSIRAAGIVFTIRFLSWFSPLNYHPRVRLGVTLDELAEDAVAD